jgi:hypothetical protein
MISLPHRWNCCALHSLTSQDLVIAEYLATTAQIERHQQRRHLPRQFHAELAMLVWDQHRGSPRIAVIIEARICIHEYGMRHMKNEATNSSSCGVSKMG